MKMLKRHLIILIGLLTAMGWTNAALAQERAPIYFDLKAGPVTIKVSDSDNTKYVYTGYIYQNNGGSVKTVTGNHSSSNQYYVYQSSNSNYTSTGYASTSGTVRVPTYNTMSSPVSGKNWRQYITNNKDAGAVIDNWNTYATAVGRTSTNNNIQITAASTAGELIVDLTIDNVWSTRYAVKQALKTDLGLYADGGSSTGATPNGAHIGVTLKVKGDNRLGQIRFNNRLENDYFHITSYSGDGSENGSLTVVPFSHQPYAPYDITQGSSESSSGCGCAISSIQGGLTHYGLVFKGATVYAASPLYLTFNAYSYGHGCVGAGNNSDIHMEISGGVLTSVCHGSGAAIGGGSGFTGRGGDAWITISGGKTYAYQYGCTTSYNDNGQTTTVNGTTYGGYGDFRFPVMSTAIGGGSTFRHIANSGTVNITGGEVYAECVGGVAIGGGGSGGCTGGYGTVSISSGATVTARSVGGVISDPYNTDGTLNLNNPPTQFTVEAGTCIGGGKGGDESHKATSLTVADKANGGDATITITGGTIVSGSIGGGSGGVSADGDTIRNSGTATINVSGGEIQGQFIMAAGAVTPPSFTMTAGHIDNTNLLASNNFFKVKEDGGAVFMEDGTCSISGGTIENATARRGGAIYMGGGTCTMAGGTIGGSSLSDGNTASQYGGGIYMAGGSFNMTGGNIKYNKATSHDGGGVYIASGGLANFSGGTIEGNQALNGNGGGFFVDPRVVSPRTQINAVTIASNKAINGGGAFVASGYIESQGATYNGNIATGNGGAIYGQGSNTTVHVGWTSYLYHNQAVKGGAIYADAKKVIVGTAVIGAKAEVVSGETVLVADGNTASDKGGGIYAVNEVEFDSFGNGKVMYNSAENDGGGVYVESGNVTLKGSIVSSNVTNSGDGGGIYVGGGDITVNAATFTSNTAASNGGAVYATGGTIKFNSFDNKATYIPTFTGNSAENGGVLFMEGGTCNINAGTLGGTHADRNKATESGGAIYVDAGTVNFATGTISYNTAGTSGGGLYIASSGTLNMTGNVTLDYNHVPLNKKGGGVYLAGVLKIGSSTARTVSTQYNFAYGTVDTNPSSVTINASNRNNVYLPHPEVNSGRTDVITVVKSGLTTSTRVGFSVPSNFVPVIYCAYSTGTPTSYAYLDSFLSGGTMAATVFDDASLYSTVHITGSSYYDPNYIYLSGGTWVQQVTSQSAAGAGFVVNGSNVTISSSEGLAYLISYINGLNDQTESHLNLNVTLTADVDMGAYAWVPMAWKDKSFTGTFDGQGHTISNLTCQWLDAQTGVNLGLFGNLGTNATVQNVNLKDAKVTTATMSSGTSYLGGIAATATGGVVQNCVAASSLETLNSSAVMGGLVGQVSGGSIQNSIAIPDMTGYQMGGLVGANSGDIYNSFANPSFVYKGGSKYFGGLVGVNTGRIENCYARVRGTAPSSTYFGYLAGNNTGASNKGLYYSYAPNSQYVATVSGTTSGTQTYLGIFTVTTATAYNYKAHDNQVTASGNTYVPTIANKQLVKTLNNWVNQDASHKATYARWLRPTTQVINGDYPLLRLPKNNAVAATNGDAYLDYGDINDHIDDYNAANQAICLYGSKEDVDTNVGIGTNALLYIDQDAVITQTGDIQAYVGVTLDNSAGNNGGGANPSFGGVTDNIDWHFFSSVLTNAKIGLVYGDDDSYGYCEYPSWHATFTADGAADSYFPTNLDSYYNEWDLYAYTEPDYHWINLKRNSHSHWHEDANHLGEHAWIDYTNDTRFEPGHGYMVALAEDGYLQAYGTLNTHTSSAPLEVNIDYTPGISWTTREGQNLLGNPYQSYLDFNEFVDENRDLWGGSTTPFYIVMDEDQADYVIYAYTASYNAKAQASRYIHPHQGFMIKAETDGKKAKFHDGMRTTTMESSWTSDFRGGDSQPNYALVNLFVKDMSGNRDIVTVELDRPEKGGVPKSKVLGTSTGRISCHYEGESYALVFTEPGLDAANIRFDCNEDGEYTMTWSTQNGEFSYLHLIDNMAGKDIDCLQETEYTFTAKTTDYASRFRLVFEYTGVEENGEEGLSTDSETFAYYANGEIHLTQMYDDASLQIVDILGRVIVSSDAARHVSTSGMTPGVYILRLTTVNGTKTQKIIIEK